MRLGPGNSNANGQPNKPATAHGSPLTAHQSGRCCERGCVYPATAASPKGYCRRHWLMFESGDWPLRPHLERNVMAGGGFKLDRPGNSTRHLPRPAHA